MQSDYIKNKCRNFYNQGKICLIFAIVVFVSSSFGLTGCSVNPVTGKKELILVPEKWELDIGKKQYSATRQPQGGDYVADPKVQAYISEVGQRLAAVSDRKLPYEFKVLNNSVPNAWALPGGKIAINRGLLTELKSEAELAAVLGHEIVHAAAKHGAKGMQRGMLLQGAVLATTIASQGKRYSNLAQMGSSIGAQLISTKYGRNAERESDIAGMNYMSRAGYDPQGAVDLQRTFVKLSEGRRQDFISGLFSSHPPSTERVENNIEHIATLPKGGESGAKRFQQVMEHLIKSKPAYDAYEEAKKALADGNTSKAATLTQKAISIEPKEGHFHSLLGDIKLADNRFESAERNYDKAISLNNNFFYYHLQRGLVAEKMHENADAKSYLERSLELLPTSSAYNALGNIARSAGQFDLAKGYYAKASGQKSPIGQAAFNSLVELDLPSSPGKYIKTHHGIERDSTIRIQLSNTTPKDVDSIVLTLQYPDSNGIIRNINQQIHGRLAAGKSKTFNTGIKIDPRFMMRVKSVVTRAHVVN